MNYSSTGYKAICWFLIFLLFFNPTAIIAANIIVDDTKTVVGQANNGVTIVNIAAASQGGVSHNRFQQFDVDTRGVIINNSTSVINTQLGGQIFGNDQLSGRSASLIINEVTGASRSQLNGYTEISGQQAGYIFANANGITCDGCGFINTPSVTLTTGDLSFNNGNLSNIAVSSGDILFEGQGFNGLNIDRVNLFTRAVNVNAAIYANDLNIITGINDIGPDLVNYTSQNNNSTSAAPEFSIDSSVLGGMYSNSVLLVGTEQGVGVNIEGEISAKDMTLDVNGNLTLKNTLIAEGAITINADVLDNEQQIIAGIDSANNLNDAGQVTINSNSTNNTGYIGSTDTLSVNSNTLNNSGDMLSNNVFNIDTNTLNNMQGNLVGQQTLNAVVGSLDNQQGVISGGEALNLAAQNSITNSQGTITGNTVNLVAQGINNDGHIASNSLNVIISNDIINSGSISANNDTLLLQAQNIDNRNGVMLAQEAVTLTTNALNNSQGVIQSLSAINAQADTLNNTAGTIASGGEVSLDIKNTLNNTKGVINSQDGLLINSTGLNNDSGFLVSSGDAVLTINDINNLNGTISAGESLQIATAQLDNFLGNIQALGTTSQSHTSIVASDYIANNQGVIQSNNELFTLTADNLTNVSSDAITANIIHTGAGLANVKIESHIDNSGEISSNGDLLLTAASLKNTRSLSLGQLSLSDYLENSGEIQAQQLKLSLNGDLINNGGILTHLSTEKQTIEARHINNELGRIESQSLAFNISTSTFDNTQGEIISLNTQGAIISADSLSNNLGYIHSDGALNLTNLSVDNNNGVIQTSGNLFLQANTLDNIEGTIAANSIDNLNITSLLNNNLGFISSNEQLNLTSSLLDNTNGIIEVLGTGDNSTTNITLTDDFINTSGALIVNNTNLSVTANSLISDQLASTSNAPQIIHAGNGMFNLDMQNALVNEGVLSSDGNLTIDAQRLNNSGTLLLSELSLTESLTNSGAIQADNLSLNLSGVLDNQQGILTQLSNNAQSITASTIDNTNGIIESSTDELTINSGVLANSFGTIYTTGLLNIDNGSLDNSSGIIQSLKALELRLSSFNNQAGIVVAQEQLSIVAESDVNNNGGTISANTFDINSTSLTNVQGVIQSTAQQAAPINSLVISDVLNSIDGLIASNNSLSVIADTLLVGDINHSGTGDLTLTGATELTLNNEVFSHGIVRLDGENTTNNGQILSSVTNVAGTDFTNNGYVETNELDIALNGALENSGTINQLSTSATSITANTINNIGSETGGLLQSNASELTLTASQFTNSGDINHYGEQAVLDVGGLNNSGTIFTQGDLSNAAGNNTLTTINNAGGTIGANGAVDLTASGDINNQQGLFVAGTQLSLSGVNLDNSLSGTINVLNASVTTSPLSTLLNFTGTINNIDGSIKSANENLSILAENIDTDYIEHTGNGVLALNANNTLTNQGALNSNGRINVNTQTFTNTNTGVASSDILSINADNVINAGTIQANDLLVTVSDTLNNTNGLLLQQGAGNQVINATTLINGVDENASDNAYQGFIVSNAETLTLNVSGNVNNATGNISHINDGSLIFNTGNINNQSGHIQTIGVLSQGSALLNSIDNSSGVIQAQNIELTAGGINNQLGVIEVQNTLNLTSETDFNNTDGQIYALAKNAGSTTITAQDGLNNAGGAIVSFSDNVSLTADTIDNTNQGVINHEGVGVLTFNAQQINNNQTALIPGSGITSNGSITSVIAALNNQYGIIAANDTLTLSSASDVNNQSGLLQANRVAINTAGELNNQSGNITQLSTNDQSITANTINNQGGVIGTNSDNLTLNAQTVNNNLGGVINHQGAGTLALNTNTLNNSNQGYIKTNGDLSLVQTANATRRAANSIDLNNQLGSIIANRGLVLQVNNDINNRGGLIQSAGNLALTGIYGGINNSSITHDGADVAGIINAVHDFTSIGGDTFKLASNANGSLNINASTSFDNTGGQVTSTAANAQINAALINNNTGNIVQYGQSSFTTNGALNNQGGYLESAAALTINTNRSTLNNQDGKIVVFNNLAINTNSGVTNAASGSAGQALIDNRNGEILTAYNAIINSDSLNNAAGKIQASDTLTLRLNSYHHTDVDSLTAGGQLTIDTNQLTLSDDLATNAGLSLVLGNSHFVNNQHISSGGAFDLTARSLTNNNGASIKAGGGSSSIVTTSNITNAGTINVNGDLTTTSTNLINSGIVGAGRDLVINAGTSIVNNNGLDGSTIFSGRNMSLFTNSLTNRYSDIYASGNLTIAKDASLNNAATLYNLSANIESGNDMILNSAIIENRADEIRFSETVGTEGRNIYVTTGNGSSSGFGIVDFSSIGRAFYSGGDDYRAYKVSENDQSQLYDELKNMGATTFEYSNVLFEAPSEHRVTPDGIVINVISANEIDESYSTRSNITAGGKLTIGSKSKIDLLLNDVSSIHANDDLTLNAKSLNNVGYNGVVNSTMISAYTTQYMWEPSIIRDIVEDPIDCIKGYVRCNVSYAIYETPLLFNNFTFNSEFISAISGGSSSGSTVFSSITSGGKLTINADEEIQNGRTNDYANSEQINNKTESVGELKNTAVNATTERHTLSNTSGQILLAASNVIKQGFSQQSGIKVVSKNIGEQRDVATNALESNDLDELNTETAISDIIVDTEVELTGALAPITPQIDLEYGALPEFDNAINLIGFLSQLKDVAVQGSDFIAINPINNHSFTLPSSNNGLFVLSTNPEHHFLVETNPEFADYNEFISSDYLLERLDIDPEEQTIRLGDGFYEQRLLRDSIFEQTGQRYTDPNINSEYDQFAFLMENAVAASEELSLSIGVSLTAEQTAALTHDIVWLEETMVDGVAVLAPVLYLAQVKESSISSNGSILAGRDVSITTDNLNSLDSIYAYNNLDVTTDDLVNRGMLASANDMSITANEFVNAGSIDAGGNATVTVDSFLNKNSINADGGLNVTSFGDIINDGAKITGGDITLTSTNGNIINQSFGGGLTTRAGVISGNGTVTLDALNDINNIGSLINGNNVALSTTNGDISLLTQSETYTSNDGKNISTRVGNTSGITASNNVSLDSGNNIDITAANITAGGNLGLNAANDVNVGVIVDQERVEIEKKRKHTISDTITNITSNLNAGGNLLVGAGNDISLTGTQMAAGESVQLIAKNDVDITSVNDTSYDYSKVVKKKSFGRKKTTITESAKQTVVEASIDAGNNIYIQAGEYDGMVTSDGDSDITMVGVALSAENDIQLVADNDVTISGATYVDFETSYKKKSGFGGFSSKEKYDAEKDSKIQNASISTTNGDINISSGNDVSLISVDSMSGNSTNIQAENNVLIAAGMVTKETESWSKSGGFLSGGNLYAMDTERSGVIDTSAQSSNVSAGGAININAGSAQIVGSNLHSESQNEQGITIKTDVGSVEILAAEQSRTSYSSSESISIGFGDALEKLTDVSGLVGVEDGVLTVNIAEAAYDKVDTTTNETTHLASNISSNASINIESIEDIIIEGSNIIADADNSANAENGDEVDSSNAGSVSLAAAGSVIIKESIDTLETQTQENHGSAEISLVVQNDYVEAAKAIAAVEDARDQVKEAESALRQHQKQQESLEATLTTLTQQVADGVAGVNQQDIDFLSLQIADLKSDDKWFETGVALAAVNLTSKITGAMQQVNTAASSSGTYGFNAGVQFDLDVTKSQSSVSTTTSQASTVMGNTVIIDAGNEEGNVASISGSDIIADAISVDAYDIDITASQDTYDAQSTSENVQTTAKLTVYGMTGGASINGSASRSESNDSSLTNNNSQLSAESISINATNNANFTGANIEANSVLDVVVGNDLIVASVQDTANGSSKSIGVSGGLSVGGGEGDNENGNYKKGINDLTGVSGGNAGINASNSRYRSQQTVLTTLISGGEANISVGGNTHIAGGLVATIDSEGNDLGNLTLDTGTISFDNLLDASTSSSNSANVNVNMSLGAEETDPASTTNQSTNETGTTLNANSSSLTVNNSNNISMSKTLATLGQGNITVGGEDNPEIAGLNRDVAGIDKELFEINSELNIDATLDHRLLTEDGRDAIKDDFVEIKEKAQVAAIVLTEDESALREFKISAIDDSGLSWDEANELVEREDVIVLADTVDYLQEVVDGVKEIANENNNNETTEVIGSGNEIEHSTITTNDDGSQVEHITISASSDEVHPDHFVGYVVEASGEVAEALEQVDPTVATVIETGIVVAQGAKGAALYISEKVISQTPLGESFNEKTQELTDEIAAVVGNHALATEQTDFSIEQNNATMGTGDMPYFEDQKTTFDKGGALIAGVLVGAAAPGGITAAIKKVNAKNKSSSGDSVLEGNGTETYFRVEGGGSGTATSQHRITANADGTININSGCSGQVCVSVGNSDHAAYFLTNKRTDGSVVVFEVDAKLHKEIMDSVIPQRPIPDVPKNPSAPKIVDPGKPGTALELPKVWDKLLENSSSKARVLSAEDFLKEFRDGP